VNNAAYLQAKRLNCEGHLSSFRRIIVSFQAAGSSCSILGFSIRKLGEIFKQFFIKPEARFIYAQAVRITQTVRNRNAACPSTSNKRRFDLLST